MQEQVTLCVRDVMTERGVSDLRLLVPGEAV